MGEGTGRPMLWYDAEDKEEVGVARPPACSVVVVELILVMDRFSDKLIYNMTSLVQFLMDNISEAPKKLV